MVLDALPDLVGADSPCHDAVFQRNLQPSRRIVVARSVTPFHIGLVFSHSCYLFSHATKHEELCQKEPLNGPVFK